MANKKARLTDPLGRERAILAACATIVSGDKTRARFTRAQIRTVDGIGRVIDATDEFVALRVPLPHDLFMSMPDGCYSPNRAAKTIDQGVVPRPDEDATQLPDFASMYVDTELHAERVGVNPDALVRVSRAVLTSWHAITEEYTLGGVTLETRGTAAPILVAPWDKGPCDDVDGTDGTRRSVPRFAPPIGVIMPLRARE